MDDMTLRYRSAVDLAGASRGLRELGDMVERSYAKIESMAAQVKAPSIHAPGAGGPGGSGGSGEAAASMDALATRIEAAINRASIPLAAFAARFGAQFDAVGGAILALAKRVDAHMKFPLFEKSIQGARNFLRDRFGEMEGRIGQFARFADRALGGIGGFRKVEHFLGSLGSVTNKGAREMGKVKAPVLNFSSSITSITNLNHVAAAASGAVHGLGLQIAAAAGFAGITYGAVNFFKGAIKGASDYNEALNASRAILGENAGAVSKLADSMARDFGAARLPILELGTSIGGLLKGAGVEGAKLDEIIGRVVRRAADLSSSKNAPIDEVGRAILIQLSGEQSDFLKRVGVDTTELALKQYALANGIVKAGGEMNQQQKILARLGITLDRTSFAQDDLKNTIDGPANAYRRLQGQVENFQVVLGTAFLPAVERALRSFNELAGATSEGFDGEALRPFIAGLNEAVDTATIFARRWRTALEIVQIQAAKMTDELIRGAKDAPGNLLYSIMKFVHDALGDTHKIAPPKPSKPALDYDKLIAGKVQEMSDLEFKRQGGSPLKAAAQSLARPPKPIDEAALASAQKAAQEMEQFVKSFKDDVRSPYEEFADIVEKGKKAFEAKLIDSAQYARLGDYAAKKSGLDKKLNPETKFGAAAEVGTSEYASSLNRALYAAPRAQKSPLESLTRQQVDLARKQLDEFKKFARDRGIEVTEVRG